MTLLRRSLLMSPLGLAYVQPVQAADPDVAIIGAGDGLNARIAWAYVGIRVVHSLVQVIVNKIVLRFVLFVLSSLCLIALIVHAAIAVFAG